MVTQRLLRQSGQSLVELLVAIGIGVIMIVAATTALVPLLQMNKQSAQVQTAANLGRELFENVRVWAEADWHNALRLSTSTANHYYLNTSVFPFVEVTGEETVAISTSTYTRSFYLEDVFRNAAGNIVEPGGSPDPSTKKLTIVYSWTPGIERVITGYITRSRSVSYLATDWAGGPGQEGPMTSINNRFATSSFVDYSSSTGSLFVVLGGVGQSVAGEIDPAEPNHWAWNDFIGWIDFYGSGSESTAKVEYSKMTGYASSSAGILSLDCASAGVCGASSYAVVNDGGGNLSGWAWNDAYGWFSFCGGQGTAACPGLIPYRVTVDAVSGFFHGYAWNAIAGWVSFNCKNPDLSGNPPCGPYPSYAVKTFWQPSQATGTLVSSVFYTGVDQGVQLNAITWRGTKPIGTGVRFQIAVSASPTGPWDFIGPDDNGNSYYDASFVTSDGITYATKLDYALHNGKPYFRYRAELASNANRTVSPRIDDIIVSWSP